MPSHTNRLRAYLQTGLLLCLLLLPVAAMAQGMTFPSGMQEKIASFVVSIVAGMHLLTWVFFIYLTVLLDPEFIFNTQNGNDFETALNSIWMLARDLVNIAFALALIGAAIYTIVTAKAEFVKANMGKFLMAIILVNFSWFVPRVIIDVGNVAAAAIYGVPSLLVTNGTAAQCRFTTSMDMRPNVSCNVLAPTTPGGATRYDCQCALLSNAEFFITDARAADLEAANWECILGKTMCLEFRTLDPTAVAGHSTVLNGLIVNHARLQGLAGVPPGSGGSEVDAIIKFLLQQVMVLVIHAALFFPLAAMLVAFAIRIPVLWLTVAFMPFALLKFVIPSEYTGDYPQKIWDYFLKAAMMPAIVAVPLTIGFILVNIGAQMLGATTVVSRLDGVGFTIADGVSNLFELLWLGITLGVLYTGVFSVLSKIEFVQPATDFIKDIGKSVGGIALKAPLSLPVIPGPAGRTTPLAMLKQFDPRAVNYKLGNDPRGLAGVLEDIKTGGAGAGGAPYQAAQAAQRFAEGKQTDALLKLNEKIAAMTHAKAANDTAGVERLIREIRQDLKIEIPISKDNPEASLRTFANELGKVRGAGDAQVRELNLQLDGLRNAFTAPPPAPAAAPPATPPPATPAP